MFEKLAILSTVGAAIGWSTNYLAIRMLFRPYQKVRIGFFSIQGLLPKRRHEVAANIARTVGKELLSVDDITKVLEEVDFEAAVRQKINNIIEQKIDNELLKKLPLFEQVKGSLLEPLKEKIMIEVMKIVKNYQGKLIKGFSEELDLEKIVYEKINSFDLHHLERVIMRVAKKELKSIELLGALLGFIIGLAQGLLIFGGG